MPKGLYGLGGTLRTPYLPAQATITCAVQFWPFIPLCPVAISQMTSNSSTPSWLYKSNYKLLAFNICHIPMSGGLSTLQFTSYFIAWNTRSIYRWAWDAFTIEVHRGSDPHGIGCPSRSALFLEMIYSHGRLPTLRNGHPVSPWMGRSHKEWYVHVASMYA